MAAADRSPTPRLASSDRVPVADDTRYRDYILTEYEPRCDPAGRLQPASLFRHLLRSEGCLEAAWPLIEALQGALGRDETVWGAKYAGGRFSVELYFYNFSRNAASNPKSVTGLARVLAPWLEFGSRVDEALPYFLCSFEFDAETLASGDGGRFRVYLGSGDVSRRACGFSYRADDRELVLENHYWFYFAAREAELHDAVRRVSESPRTGPKACWSTLLPRYLRDCFTICYAVKPRRDGLYYSRLASAQISRFVREHADAHGAIVADVLDAHESEFAHLSWDLGFDFAAAPGARSIAIDRFAIHGVV